MNLFAGLLALFGYHAAPAPQPAPMPPVTYEVRSFVVTDEKSVFATIQSTYTVPARVRTGGTIVSLAVRQGDYVTRGQIIANIGDPKLTLQSNSYAAQVAAAQAQVAQAKADYDRAEHLVGASPATCTTSPAPNTAARNQPMRSTKWRSRWRNKLRMSCPFESSIITNASLYFTDAVGKQFGQFQCWTEPLPTSMLIC